MRLPSPVRYEDSQREAISKSHLPPTTAASQHVLQPAAVGRIQPSMHCTVARPPLTKYCCCTKQRGCIRAAAVFLVCTFGLSPYTVVSAPLLMYRMPVSTLSMCPIAVAVALKPDVFEGLRFELTRPLNQNFFLTHRYVSVKQPGFTRPSNSQGSMVLTQPEFYTASPTVAASGSKQQGLAEVLARDQDTAAAAASHHNRARSSTCL